MVFVVVQAPTLSLKRSLSAPCLLDVILPTTAQTPALSHVPSTAHTESRDIEATKKGVWAKIKSGACACGAKVKAVFTCCRWF